MADPALRAPHLGLRPLHRQPSGRSFAIPRSFPAAWVALRAREVDGWPSALRDPVTMDDRSGEAWFIRGDHSAREPRPGRPGPNSTARPRPISRLATSTWGSRPARPNVRSWDGRTRDRRSRRLLLPDPPPDLSTPAGLSRARRGGAARAEGEWRAAGIPLTGTGPEPSHLEYRPTGLRPALVLSVGAAAAALICLLAGMAGKQIRAGPRPAASKMIG